ncbi:hemolysin III family protein [Chloroflexi bacterium TSY]|nr:hemolysin III family protein [Chloroflexi bacterium TSY]
MAERETYKIERVEELFYTPNEEWAHALTHAVGLALSIAGLWLLIYLAIWYGDFNQVVAFAIYGFTTTFLYTTSTLYHAVQRQELKRTLRLLDHVAIYLTIAGAYTPFLLLSVPSKRGRIFLTFIWIVATIGVGFKTFVADPHRFERISVVAYLAMGWMVVFVLPDIIEHVPLEGVVLIVASGLCYSFGIIFYKWDSLLYNHAIWHLFVLAGSICHFFAVLTLTGWGISLDWR